MIKYELSFTEALRVLEYNEGWVQGEQFGDGVVLMFDKGTLARDYIHVHDFTVGYKSSKFDLQITRTILEQKYRVVHTQPDAQRICK